MQKETPEIYMIPVMSGDDGLLTVGAMALGAATALLAGKVITYVSEKIMISVLQSN